MKMLVGSTGIVKGAPVLAVPVGKGRLPLIDSGVPPAYIIDIIKRRERDRNQSNEEGRRIWAPSPTDDRPQRKRREPEENSDGPVVIPLDGEDQGEDGPIVISLK